MTTFIDYLVGHARATDTPEGDFIRDSRELIELGKFTTRDGWVHLHFFLTLHHADSDVIAAARNVHRNYRRWLAAATSK